MDPINLGGPAWPQEEEQEMHHNIAEGNAAQGQEHPTGYTGISARGDEAFRGSVNDALEAISSGPGGQKVLNDLAAASNVPKGKKAIIRQSSNDEIKTRATLTQHQAQKAGNPPPEVDRMMANKLAQKRLKGAIKGRGTQAEVHWRPDQSLHLDPQGRPTGLVDGDGEGYVTLGHELEHATGIVGGTFKRGGNPEDPATPSGKEEMRAIRSENAIRQDHGLTPRTQFAFAPNAEAVSDSESSISALTEISHFSGIEDDE